MEKFISFQIFLFISMRTQIWHLPKCAAWWLFATALLHILQVNLIAICFATSGRLYKVR